MPFLRLLLRDNNVDVALINETHLHASHPANLPGYHVLRLDVSAEKPRRGLLVAVRRNLIFRQLPDLDAQSFQSLGVETQIGAQVFRAYAIYRPIKSPLRTSEVHQLLGGSIPTLAVGDWNAKHPAWRCASHCTTGRRLHQDSIRHGYEVVGPDEPTHFSFTATHQPTTIDLVVHKGIEAMDLETLPDAFGSDHQPVLVKLTGRLTLANGPPPGRRISWVRFEANIQKQLHHQKIPIAEPIVDTSDVDRLEARITGTIQEALEEATTPATSRTLPPIPAHIRALVERKRRVRSEWQQTRDPAAKTRLNKLIERIREALVETGADEWERRIEEADEDQPSLNRLCRQLTKKKPATHPLMHPDGSLRYTAAERAEILAEHLEATFQPNASERPAHHARLEADVTRALANPERPLPAPPYFSPELVAKTIKGLKPKKAPGLDSVTNRALRHLPRMIITALTRLFNAVLRLGYFPRAWKEGLVIMLPKARKNLRNPDSYRPITLLSAVAKLFEKLLLPLLQAHLQPRNEQFGFRSGHSTTLQVARVVHYATTAFYRKESATAAFLDVSRAFDRVWHPGLLHKVLNAGIPHYVAQVLADYLRGRTFRVRVESARSSSHPIAAGVPQVSILSPALYSLYTDDIPIQQDTTLALYADDIALLTKSLNPNHAAKKLQRALDLLPDWLAEWRLKLNIAKTQAISFGHHIRLPPPLRLQGQQVPWSSRATYLGVVIDRRLSMTGHVKKAANAARTALILLRPLFKSRLPIRTKLSLYKAYIRPHLAYASPAWYALISENQRRILQVVQNLALRRVIQAPYCVRNSTLQRDLHMESLEVHIGRLASNAFRRADASDHPHLRSIAPLHTRPPDERRRQPRDIIPPSSPDSTPEQSPRSQVA